MKLTSVAQKVAYAVYFALQFRSPKLALILAYYQTTPARTSGATRDGSFVKFGNTGNRFPLADIARYKHAIKYLFHTLNTPGSNISRVDEREPCICLQGVILRATTASNVFAINEIFSEGIYDILLAGKDYVVIDIGMNVGTASLFFASKDQVHSVIGYEPFASTFSEAAKNLELNPTLSPKICPRNLGVSSTAQRKFVTAPEPGLLSASTIDPSPAGAANRGSKIEIKLISIHEVLEHARTTFPNCPIILKVDCEGEEYSIFESLSGTNDLDCVSIVIVEWHQRGPDGITRTLCKSGFNILSRTALDSESGIIYGFRD